MPLKRNFTIRRAADLQSALRICLELRDCRVGGRLGPRFWSFRGQRNAAWPLGLHGPANPRDLDTYFRQFRRRCKEFRPPDHIPEDDQWRWLFYAQHQRLKTRLLDWTKDPLVAIYFAVENIISRANDDSPPGAVWALHVPRQYFKHEDELKEQKREKKWIMVDAPPLTPGMARQAGLFTFHPDRAVRIQLNAMRRRPHEELVKIVFSGGPKCAKKIRKQLGILNVHHGSLFPDAQGVAEFISHEWSLIGLKGYRRRAVPAKRRRHRA